MTEAEWLKSDDPAPMLEFLGGRVSDRKLRLFAVGCCRQVLHLLNRQKIRRVIDMVEQVADGANNIEEVQVACVNLGHRRFGNKYATWAVQRASNSDAFSAAKDAGTYSSLAATLSILDRTCQAVLVRDIFGNPFRPVTVEPAWLTPTVVSLATAIYEERAFDRLPILADALEDAGCTNVDMLNHCRQPGEHVRGCWCVDLLLDKR